MHRNLCDLESQILFRILPILLIVCQVLQHAEHNHVIFWHLFTFTSNPRLQYKLTYLAKSSGSNTFAQLPPSKRNGYKESCECVQLLGF